MELMTLVQPTTMHLSDSVHRRRSATSLDVPGSFGLQINVCFSCSERRFGQKSHVYHHSKKTAKMAENWYFRKNAFFRKIYRCMLKT